MAAQQDMVNTTDLLTCPICLEIYTEPKMLHCQHTFCLKCLRGLVSAFGRSKIICPTCRVPQNVPARGIRSLPGNLVINNLLSVVRGKTVCSYCGGDRSVALCNHCDQTLCQECRMRHPRLSVDLQNALDDIKLDLKDESVDLGAANVERQRVNKCLDFWRAFADTEDWLNLDQADPATPT